MSTTRPAGDSSNAGPVVSNMNKSALDLLYMTETENTFQYDDELPSLPLPSLRTTLNKYLDTVRPHVSEEEFAATESLVRDFESGAGKLLHEKLVHKATQSKNWVSQSLGVASERKAGKEGRHDTKRE